MIETTTDGLLGGRLTLRQPARGYRVAIDAPLVAAAVPASAGERIVDLGCGVGAVALCVAARIPGVDLLGIEIDPELADLARLNATENASPTFGFRVVTGDVAVVPADRLGTADHAVINPPFHAGRDSPSPDPRRAVATHDTGVLAIWVDAARRHLKPRGTLTLIWRADRLAEAMAALARGFGGVTVLPLWPAADRPAKRVILGAVAGGRDPGAVLPGLVLHAAEGAFTPSADAILRSGGALSWRTGRA